MRNKDPNRIRGKDVLNLLAQIATLIGTVVAIKQCVGGYYEHDFGLGCGSGFFAGRSFMGIVAQILDWKERLSRSHG
jgi:hypothetical protein